MKNTFKKLMILVGLVLSYGLVYSQEFDIELDLTDSTLWTIDEVHLGTRQIMIGYDSVDSAVVMHPTWALTDTNSTNTGISNIENGKLHTYQHIDISDCTQSEVHFEINIPQEYIDEGKMEFVFSLQAGAAGDYLFNGHTFKMSEFEGNGGAYKKIVVLAVDYNDDLEKLRKIERVNIIFERKGSFVSAPIKIRNLGIVLNKHLIVPPDADEVVINPSSYYKFNYITQDAINKLEVRISAESMNITRKLNTAGDGMELIPQWADGQIPTGHSGNVYIVQQIGQPHDFEPFVYDLVINIPQAYYTENKIQLVMFVQAGEKGFWVWSGIAKSLSTINGVGDQDVTVRLSTDDFLTNPQKKKNLIQMVGFAFHRNGSTLTEPITVKSAEILLDGIVAPTEIPNSAMIMELIAYPNPSDNGLFQLNKECQWEVFNSIGVKVKEGYGNSINISAKGKGLYFVNADNSVIKIIVN